MALSVTDEFWHSPIVEGTGTAPGSGDCCSSNDLGDPPLPPAHHQLLSEDSVYSEALKGYDHGRRDGFDCADDLDDGYGAGESRYCCWQRPPALAKQQRGGGPWRSLSLSGLARPSNHTDREASRSEGEEDGTPPGLVRVPSGSSLESDEDSAASDDSPAAPKEEGAPPATGERPRRGVSFAPRVRVQPVPHASALACVQRRSIYSSSDEVRRNKVRNKREYRYDGCDWRDATEEWEMGIDMVTGELVHPAHEYWP